ncbi:MAG: matrixin family metalloprotease [Planctomycetota bacterium]|nr:matrixin family metalloprotease [Planctomycetota bacterium]
MSPQLAGIWNRIFPKKPHRKSAAGRYAPAIESLESREMLSAIAAPQWEDASRLTLSFAPEGTLVNGQASSLTAALGGAGTAEQVKQAILSAFQKLEAGVNVSVGVVADNGSPLGTVGRSQGDTRFGDIRIAAAHLGSSVYAYSVPINSAAAGTWSGEIVFNIDTPLSSLNDVASVALHEAGHVLGLKGNSTAGSMMNESWQPGQLLTPSSTDLAKLVSLYGTRDLDVNEAFGSYDGYWTATDVDRPDSFTGTTPLVTWGDINVSSDIDWYRVRSPQGYNGTVKIELRTAGISTLAGQISVYNSSGDLLGSGANSVSFQAVSGSVYVRVKSATSGLSGFGTYALTSSYVGAPVGESGAANAALREHPLFDVDGVYRRRRFGDPSADRSRCRFTDCVPRSGCDHQRQQFGDIRGQGTL